LNEGNSGTTAFNFTVSLSAASSQTVSVNFATANGTATAGEDYTAASGTLTFAPGEVNKTLTVQVNGDALIEGNETFTVNLSNASNATIAIAEGTGTILNDDVCSYSISPANLSVGASGGAGNTITVTTQAGCSFTAASNDSFITINSGASGTGNGTISFTVATNTGAERMGTITVGGQTFTITQANGATTALKTLFDFDGDKKADVSVFRPDNGFWYLLNSTSGFTAARFGLGTDKLAPADYDGDGRTDIAVWRETTPTQAYFYILQSATNTFRFEQFGTTGDIPVSADFDGDGKADVAVYRNGASAGAQSFFFYRPSAAPGVDFRTIYWGAAGNKPVVGDYDGDGKADAAVFDPATGIWYVLRSLDNQLYAIHFGSSTDKLVPADYDGDGKTDVAVFRPDDGTWYLMQSRDGFTGAQFGFGTDTPTPADYDGDGRTDIAVFRDGTWYLNRSRDGFTGVTFGNPTDKPVPNAFVP
jgi:hypothetical protein